MTAKSSRSQGNKLRTSETGPKQSVPFNNWKMKEKVNFRASKTRFRDDAPPLRFCGARAKFSRIAPVRRISSARAPALLFSCVRAKFSRAESASR